MNVERVKRRQCNTKTNLIKIDRIETFIAYRVHSHAYRVNTVYSVYKTESKY